MRKLGLYAGIIMMVIFFCSCTKQENEGIQNNTETEGTVGGIQDHTGMKEETETVQTEEGKYGFIIGGSNIPDMMNKTKVFEFLWDMESASVSDSDYTITLGMLFEDFEYYEEELPTEVVDNYGGLMSIHGVWRDLYFHPYTDVTIYTGDYNPIIQDMSGENIYIVAIGLDTPQFITSKGISVGASLDELREAYRDEKPIYKEEETYRLIFTYEEHFVRTTFCIDKEQEQVTEITLYLW